MPPRSPRRVPAPVLIAGFLCLAPLASAPAGTLGYRLQYREPGNTTVRVVMSPSPSLPTPVVVVVPRAIPMGYGEAPYDAFVEDVRAFDDGGRVLPVTREDGPRWRVGGDGASVARVEYRVDVARMERVVLAASDASRARRDYLSLLGYSVFAYLEGFEEEPVTLVVEGPPGWPVLSTLAPAETEAEPRTVRASGFYALADSQVVMGPALQVRHVQSAAPLTVAVYAEAPGDVESVSQLAATALRRVADYFGSVPFAHYTVIQEYLAPLSPEHRYGFSMEHLDSSTFYLAADSAVSPAASDADRRRTLYNYAHHMSHAWIPKRSYGEGYYPFAWELTPVIDTIWFSEGFAQYAAIEAVAAGEPDPVDYRRRMLETRFARPLEAMPAFLRSMPLVQLSRVASTRYAEDFRTGRSSFARGGLMAAEIDDRIRQRTAGAKGLRDALRHLVAWSARSGRAFRIDELPLLFAEATGVEVGDVFEQWLATTPVRR